MMIYASKVEPWSWLSDETLTQVQRGNAWSGCRSRKGWTSPNSVSMGSKGERNLPWPCVTRRGSHSGGSVRWGASVRGPPSPASGAHHRFTKTMVAYFLSEKIHLATPITGFAKRLQPCQADFQTSSQARFTDARHREFMRCFTERNLYKLSRKTRDRMAGDAHSVAVPSILSCRESASDEDLSASSGRPTRSALWRVTIDLT